MKTEKFKFKEFLEYNKDKCIFLEHYNDTLKISHQSYLYIKSYSKLNNRLYNCGGIYIDYFIFYNDDDRLHNVRIYNNKYFNLSELNVKGMNIEYLTLEELAYKLKKFGL